MTTEKKEDLLQNWLWNMEVIDKSKGIRKFQIKDYSKLRDIFEYEIRISKKQELARIIKILNEHINYFSIPKTEFSKAQVFYLKSIIDEINKIDEIYLCPRCKKKFKVVNGLYVLCECGYISDSTYEQIMGKEEE